MMVYGPLRRNYHIFRPFQVRKFRLTFLLMRQTTGEVYELVEVHRVHELNKAEEWVDARGKHFFLFLIGKKAPGSDTHVILDHKPYEYQN